MAIYKYGSQLSSSTSDEFDKTHSPGTLAPFSGIYRCIGCGLEVASNERQPLPPQNDHQHRSSQGSIRWKLLVFAVHKAA